MNTEKNTTETAAATLPATTSATANFLAASQNLENLTPQFSIVPTYAQLDKKPQRFIFAGIGETSYSKVDETTGEVVNEYGKTVQLVAAGKMYVHRGAQLIKTFEENRISQGQPVEISLKEEVKNSKGGKTKIFDVIILG